VRDGISFARLGIPAVALVTTKFWEQGHFVARSVGMPDVPRVQLPHPVAGTGSDRMHQIADEAADEIISALGIGGALGIAGASGA
jgi:hypothetical protein